MQATAEKVRELGERAPGEPEAPRRNWRAAVPKVASRILFAVAVLCALAAVSAAFGTRVLPLRRLVDALLMPAPANLGYAVFLAMLAFGVNNRKRVAFWLLTGYFGLQLVTDAVLLFLRIENSPPAWAHVPIRLWWFLAGNLVVTVVVLTVLACAHQQFFARVQRASLPKALATVAGLITVFSLIGWGLVAAFPGSVRRAGHHELGYAIKQVTGGALDLNVHRGGMAPGWINLVLGFFGAVTLITAVAVLLRSQRAAASLDADEEHRVRDLLDAYGQDDSLGYFATRRDKEVIFAPSGRAAVTYRVVGGVSLASGDPIGDRAAWGAAIVAWLQEAREYAWTPAIMGAGEAGATAYARAGMRVLKLGDEAILRPADFSLEGREMRQVRQAVARVERAGYTVRIRRHRDIPAAEMERVVFLAARWRDTETERGFSMALGRLGDPADGACVLVEALDRNGAEAALLSFVPWGGDGLSLDLMRRDRNLDNGLVECMVAALMAEAPRLGVTRVSLNFAVFRAVFEEGARIGAGPVLLAWRRLLLFLSRWFQLESLYRSNIKYQPQWIPRFLCFEDVSDLAKVGFASAVAEGFVEMPRALTRLRRGKSEAATPAAGEPRIPLPRVPLDAGAETEPAVAPAVVQSEQTQVRLAKLSVLRAEGIDPYPPGFARTHACGEVREAHAGLAPDTATGQRVSVAGRLVLQRDHGGVCFAMLRDASGDLQVMLTVDRLGRQPLWQWRKSVDLGDHVGVTGEVVTSRLGELSVLADSWTITAKCLHPLPDKRRGLADLEMLSRRRHLDLIVRPAARDMLRIRSAAVHALRTTLIGRDFLEVETPILQPVHGGANARPFVTHSNAYDMPLYLRIAPELYLKRLAVGGMEKVFELGRDFRNEGVDATHNPEFSMLEAYEAYGDYTSMRTLARDLILAAATAAHGAPVARRDGVEFDLDTPWPVVTVHDAVSTAVGDAIGPDTDVAELRRLATMAGVALQPGWSAGQIVLEMYEKLVEKQTQAPTFYTDFPTEVSPLTRAHRDEPRLAERWDLVAFGMELGTAYTELVDPVEQRRRLTAQSLRAAGGDPEAMQLDEDFLQALEYAMPPTGGLGLGVDRLIMLLTGHSIRETVPFPLNRPATRRTPARK
ncbi:bifunctional lysylphosphatidylglycerol synthetase/lysine--tRNA ligase LysX [Couchioplanes azureus]|uniref:bifunctional lysylphosphatidylglycerol synthetase/lysine--tRNA ligase LysX n=1 Tax=Couchioplanes caeruleus TaxID=56438 RepID=UPI0019848EC9|nr:bifunctional lysylphosphatidylglycerol synthetase/lysine--tRNA ligase LysX [Couchioplanes caeruleus]GGQ39869.1 lysine--tRNA ligase [Couchioplanes caeruleus subsp. azureus]